MWRLRGSWQVVRWFGVAVYGVALFACSSGGGSSPPNSEPPGLNQNPQQTWVRCVCAGCNANGLPLGTDHMGGCVPSACADTGDLNAACATICASYGLQGCTGAAAEPSNFCEEKRCELCSPGSACSAGVCNQPAHACGIECQANDGNCSTCDQCVVLADGSPGTCLPQNATAMCTSSHMARIRSSAIMLATDGTSYLDRYFGRLSVDLEPTSSLSFTGDSAHGSGALTAGALALTANGCPGSTCAVRLNDLLARADLINATVTVVDVLGVTITKDVPVTNAVITNVRPTTLAASPTGDLTIPPRGLEVMVALTANGTRNEVRTLNDTAITGAIDFATGKVHLGGSFNLSGANATFSLDGHVTNSPPQAVLAPPPTTECTGALTPVALDGSGSTDAPPGPGITDFNWYSAFDLATGRGTLLATGATPTVALPLGDTLLTLQVLDGEGALGLAQADAIVQDTTPPRIVPAISQIEVCSAAAHDFAVPLPRLDEACSASPVLTGQVLSIDGVALSPPVALSPSGHAVLRPGRLVVRWTATDDSGNTSSLDQTIDVVARPALYANGALQLDPEVNVVEVGGGFATIANGGGGRRAETELGVLARVGNVLSTPVVELHTRARVEGSLKTSTPVVRHLDTFIAGPIFQSGPVPLPAFPTLSPPPPGPGPNVSLKPGQTRALSPGVYGAVSLDPRSTLQLTSGTYRFGSLRTAPLSVVEVSMGTSSTSLYVADGDVELEGSFVDPAGGSNGFLLGVLGAGQVDVTGAFVGTLVAPLASIDLGPATKGYTGQFVAHDIRVGPHVTVTYAAFGCHEP